MTLRRVMITLSQEEREALVKLSKQERRDPRAQAAYIIRCELERAGLLKQADSTSEIKENK